jgi:hypothetical protein
MFDTYFDIEQRTREELVASIDEQFAQANDRTDKQAVMTESLKESTSKRFASERKQVQITDKCFVF